MDELGDLEIVPLTPMDAEAIALWRYSGEYAAYDPSVERKSNSPAYMLDPSNGFFAVRRESSLIGFCSFGADAQVPGGAYDMDALDVGAGMDPAFVGKGHGRAFLDAVVEHAASHLGALTLRATIASWNERARRAAQSVGFRPVATFATTRGEFTILVVNRSARR